MPRVPTGEHLTDRRYVSVILRLLLDRLEHLVYGEVLDVEGGARKRFTTWQELPDAVQAIVSDEAAPTHEDKGPC